MGVNIILIIIGFVLLIYGADFLVDGASFIAKKFHISEIVIGLTIVSIGTSLPELFVSLNSGINGYTDMAIGNVIGSNICNLLLILGVSTVINPIEFKNETKFIEIPMCFALTIIFWILCNLGGGISKLDSTILLVLFVCFLIYTIVIAIKEQKQEKKTQEKEKQEGIKKIEEKEEIALSKLQEKMLKYVKNQKIKNNLIKITSSSIFQIILIILGIILLKYGGDFVVENAKQLAQILGISQRIIAVTIVALGTSLPELVTTVVSAIKKDSDIAIGNIIGSNIFNFLLIIRSTGILKDISFNSSYNLDMIILAIATFVLGLFPFIGKKDKMTRVNGIIYLGLFIIYFALLFLRG